jgi:hypothetical protein
MALSADDLTYIRDSLPYTSGSGDSLFVSDAMLNYLYANKADSDVDKTIAYAAQMMCAKASNKVARTNTATGDTVQSQQEREAICKAADKWAAQTGIGAGAVTAGTISLGIDEEDNQVSNP